MSQKNFAVVPSVSISRSKFKRPYTHKTSFNLGQIVPLYVDADILPGDTVSMDLAALVRMSNPIAPIMDNIFIDYYAFFVPNRLVYDDWKQFMGENTSSYGAATEPNMPQVDIADLEYHPGKNSIGAYMGLPVDKYTNESNTEMVSALPGRAYYLIYNEWFRDQNLIAPIYIYKDSTNNHVALDPNAENAVLLYNGSPLKAAKESDYFTRALPYAQKASAPVSLPLGTRAELKVGSALYGLGGDLALGFGSSPLTQDKLGRTAGNVLLAPAGSGDETVGATNLYVDLQNATAASINQLRFAFQYQKFLEKDAIYGSRYWELLKSHFSITAPDASLQRPELLGHFRQYINIDQVLQTTGYSATPSSNKLGLPGANSVTGKSGHLITKSFVEHGILMVLGVARHDQTYGQGINRMWTRKHRTDYYFPVFANLGLQEIKNKEIFADPDGGTDDGTFGFQEAWAEYRWKPNTVSGVLNPSISNSLNYWTLANNFGELPTLGQFFIEQGRANINRCLVTGNSGPDFVADFLFSCIYVRPMPLYSLPGLIDHH